MSKRKSPLFIDVSSIDFRYYMDIEYDRVDHDETGKTDYHRHSKLENIHIVNFSPLSISAKIVSFVFTTNSIQNIPREHEILCYCLERVINATRLTPEDFDIGVEGGYYGEELGAVKIYNKSKTDAINDILKELLEADDDGRIRIALKYEYGYVLDSLISCVFSVENISRYDLIFPNEQYASHLNRDILNLYKDYSGILGVVKFFNGSYKVIDGYHRIMANQDDVIRVIVAR